MLIGFYDSNRSDQIKSNVCPAMHVWMDSFAEDPSLRNVVGKPNHHINVYMIEMYDTTTTWKYPNVMSCHSIIERYHFFYGRVPTMLNTNPTFKEHNDHRPFVGIHLRCINNEYNKEMNRKHKGEYVVCMICLCATIIRVIQRIHSLGLYIGSLQT